MNFSAVLGILGAVCVTSLRCPPKPPKPPPPLHGNLAQLPVEGYLGTVATIPSLQNLGPWRPVSRVALVGWLLFYAGFLVYAALDRRGFLLIDYVNLVVHEGGHLLFGWFGRTLGLWGGTMLQWLAPALLASYFFMMRQTTGFCFCLFMLFENFLYTATYMADARAQNLDLVSIGDSDSPHDWFNIFSNLGLLQYDTRIAAVVRACGWLGMFGVVGWLALRGRQLEDMSDYSD